MAKVAAIWAETLGLEKIGIEENFFEIGGHSLLAIRLISRLRSRLGVELPLRSIFEAPTIADLSTMIENALQTQAQPLARQTVDDADDREEFTL